MKIGLQINRFNWKGAPENIGEHLAKLAQAAEDVGMDSVWVMDHFFQIGHLGPAEDPMLEAYTTLGYLAAATKKVTLGTMVTGVIYREPALLIKAVTTLDVLSGGRAYFGIGAGWNEEEAIGLGFSNTPLTSSRFERLEETLQIAQKMFRDDETPFQGKHHQLGRPINHPQPLSKPHPPILIGGGGELRTLRLVAQYADACNLFAPTAIQKFEVLKRHCQELGRNYDDIEKTVLIGRDVATAAAQPAETLALAKQLRSAGADHAIFSAGDAELSAFEKFAPLAKQLAEL